MECGLILEVAKQESTREWALGISMNASDDGQPAVFRLLADANKGLGLRSEIDYFRDHFVGRPLLPDWAAPSIRVINSTKPLQDFVSWMYGAPVVRESARNLLERDLRAYCEFLPLVSVKGVQLYALNVTEVVDCLDVAKSEVKYTIDGRILAVNRYAFCAGPKLLLFKVPEDPGAVFVTAALASRIEELGLRGALFLDPAVNVFEMLLNGSGLRKQHRTGRPPQA